MEVFWRIAYAFAISALFIKPLQADENNEQTGKSGNYGATSQRMQKMTQAEASTPYKWSIGSPENYKWAIQPSSENDKWALPSSDKPTGPDKPAASAKDSGKKPASYFVPSSSYATQPETDGICLKRGRPASTSDNSANASSPRWMCIPTPLIIAWRVSKRFSF